MTASVGQLSPSPHGSAATATSTVAVILGAVPFVALAATVVSPLSLGEGVAWTVLLACALLPVALVPRLRADAFDPYSLLVLGVVVGVILPALYVADTRSPATPISTYVPTMLLFAGAMVVTAVGWWAWRPPRTGGAGRLLPLGRHCGERALASAVPAALILYVIGWAARLARADLGYSHLPNEFVQGREVVGYLNDLSTVATLSYVVLLGAVFQSSRLRSARRPIAVVLVLVEAVGGALQGGRSAIAVPVLFALLAWGVAVRPVRFRTLLIVYLSALFFVAPLLTAYRSALYADLSSGAKPSLDLVASSAERTPAVIHDAGGFRRLQAVTASRTASLVESSLRTTDRVPQQVPHEYGRVLAQDIASLIVPRVLYPEKSAVIVGQRRAAQFWDLDPRQSGGTSISIGLPAEMYLNFSWLGVLAFLFFGGFLRAFGDRLASLPRASVSRLAWTVFAYTSVATIEADLANYLVGIIRTGLVFAVFVLVITYSSLLTAPSGLRQPAAARLRLPAASGNRSFRL